MTEHLSRFQTLRASLRKVDLDYIAAIALVFLSLVALLFSSIAIPHNISILYWPLGVKYVFWLRCLPLPLALVSIVICALRNSSNSNLRLSDYSGALIVGILLIFACACTQYFAIWTTSSIDHIGSVQFKGSVYHLAKVYQYDEGSNYFLGKCNSTRYLCKFHKVFDISFMNSGNVELSENGQYLRVELDGDEVYTFDGSHENCIDSELYSWWCVDAIE